MMPLTAHAFLLGDRLTVDRSSHPDAISMAPFAYRRGEGYVVIFRYGALVAIGLSDEDKAAVLKDASRETTQPGPIEEERLTISIQPVDEERVTPGGVLELKELTPAHVLVLADILAKSVALARYEKETAQVFDTIEPAATTLAVHGRIPKDRHGLLQLIGSALLAQHRVSGRIAFAEKPEILWDQPSLERFYARLEDEFEIVERGTLLNGKMTVLASAAETFTDMMDTQRSARLEFLIVILIVAELILGAITFLHH